MSFQKFYMHGQKNETFPFSFPSIQVKRFAYSFASFFKSYFEVKPVQGDHFSSFSTSPLSLTVPQNINITLCVILTCPILAGNRICPESY